MTKTASGRTTATSADVAKVAGVSVATVSYVVNNSRNVRPQTRRRVEAAIAELGYRRNQSARALRRSRTESIGFVVSDTGITVFAEIVRGIEHEARRTGYSLMLMNSMEERALEERAVETLTERRVDGLLIAPVAGSSFLTSPRRSVAEIPVVLVDRLARATVDQVGAEAVRASAMLIRHLVEHGHERIGIVRGTAGIPTNDARLEGALLGIREAGLVVDDLLVADGGLTEDEARAAALRLVTGPDRPTALFSVNTVMTLGTLSACEQAGLSIPEDLALVTYDGFPWAHLFRPRLTSMIQPAFSIGRDAMRLMLRRIACPTAEPRTVTLPPKFVHLESCGCGSTATQPGLGGL